MAFFIILSQKNDFNNNQIKISLTHKLLKKHFKIILNLYTKQIILPYKNIFNVIS